jgi:NAD(P)-dependent dehydrogenase (short-subunit alcohol dehydrogenase family)
MRDLVGRVAVVTGAASGIGAAMVARFVGAGMRVVASDVDGDALAGAVGGMTGDVRAVVADVSRRVDVEGLATAALDEFGAVHVVCNNAGIVIAGRIEDLTEQEWRRVLDVDLWGAIHGVRVFLPLIERAGEGHLVSTSSTSGLGAPPFIAPYAVAKAGVIGLMESLRRELTERNSPVGASVLCPGPVATGLIANSGRLAGGIADRSASRDGQAFDRTSGAMLAASPVTPATVADHVVDAITANRFWILTNPEWGAVLRERVDRMLRDGSLGDRPRADPSPDE